MQMAEVTDKLLADVLADKSKNYNGHLQPESVPILWVLMSHFTMLPVLELLPYALR